MTLAEALFLGLIQGITEFLPISSSGHLVIGQHFLGINQDSVIFEAVVHIGSLLSIIIFFRNELKKIDLEQIKLVTLATFPTVIVGLLIKPHLEFFFSSLAVVTFGYLITTLLLFSTRKLKSNQTAKVSFKNALILGISQSIAILPGVSRSGTTVSVGLNLQIAKELVFYFSFLMAIPAILGAFVLIAVDADWSQLTTASNFVGFSSSLVSGVLALGLLKKITKQSKLHWFSLYTGFVFIGLLLYQILA